MTRLTNNEKMVVALAKRDATKISAVAGTTNAWAALQDALIAPFRRQAARQELRALDDQLLRDIGIERGQIEAVARRTTAPTLSLRQALRAVGTEIGQSWRLRRERRSAYRQLMALDDRMLGDIGLTRGDIPDVVAALTAGTTGSARDTVTVRRDFGWLAEEVAIKSLSPINRNRLPEAA